MIRPATLSDDDVLAGFTYDLLSSCLL
jgi:hypothetical protein